MSEEIKASEKEVLPDSMDFNFLKERGIEHIEKLAGKVWTDYNTHDPGITILEHLCFALADLNYRSSFPVQDILSGSTTSDANNGFLTPRDILHCSPVTPTDFRKLIIDCEGVKDAKVVPLARPEPHIYINKAENALQSLPLDESKGLEEDVLPSHGLYKVLLELEYDEEFGDLNANRIIRTFDSEGITLDISFPFWDNAEVNWEDTDSIISQIKVVSERHSSYTTVHKQDPGLPGHIVKLLNLSIDGPSVAEYYKKKVEKVLLIKKEVERKLHGFRNLCEDFVSYESIKLEYVGLEADIEVSGGADINEILLEIYYRVNHHLSPQVTFRDAYELFEKGHPVEDIFDGVPLDHGFILTEDLPKLRKRVHLSDLVNIIMDIPGINAVKRFNAAIHPQGVLMRGGQRWCVTLNPESNHVPRLSPELSEIVFYKDGIPVGQDKFEVIDKYQDKNAFHKKWTTQTTSNIDFSIPEGRDRNTWQYYSIQNDFTQNYGINRDGLPTTASAERKIQVKQLKGYLLFFEQILANFHSQLNGAGNLLTGKAKLDQSYFYQLVDTAPDIEDVYDREVIDKVLSNHEDPLMLNRRRNQFIDHLLARLGLDPTQYFMLSSGLDGEKEPDIKIAEKQKLMAHYPAISADRAIGFNYRSNEVWDTANVAGLKKRVCLLMGIENYNRRSLAGLGEEQSNEGFHLIEHMMLRPRVSRDWVENPLHHRYLEVFADSRCQDGPWEEDPYSSLITIVAPNWIGRFAGNDPRFRAYFEKTTYLECPAHISVQFVWLGPEQMDMFESSLKNWLTLNADIASDPRLLTDALNQVVDHLNGFLSKESYEEPETAIPEIPEKLIDKWTVHDFGDPSQWIFGAGNTVRQTQYIGNCKRVTSGEGTVTLYEEVLDESSEAIEVVLTVEADAYAEAGLVFLWKSPNDYWMLHYRAYYNVIVVSRVKNGIVEKVLENPVRNLRGKKITLRVDTRNNTFRCLQSSPNTIGSEFHINTIETLVGTRYGLYTRYSNNTEFNELESIRADEVKKILPLPGLGNLFIGPTNNGPVFKVK